jgi:hypothetical protein
MQPVKVSQPVSRHDSRSLFFVALSSDPAQALSLLSLVFGFGVMIVR